MAGAQVTVVATQVEKQRLGYQAISLTNFANTSEPQIAAGSKVEIGGSLFEFADAESVTGWSGIASSSDVYIKLTVSGSSVTASFTTTAPSWDTAKQGWYSGSDRYVGGLYKDASDNYTLKWLYEEKEIASIKRYGTGAVALPDGTIASAKISWTLSEGSQAVTAGSPYTLPAGLYIVLTPNSTYGVQAYINSSWTNFSQTVNLVHVVFSDGTNIRLTASSGTQTFRWLKLA